MSTKPLPRNHKCGDIVLVLFPNSDLRSAKRRPALVVQADELGTGLSQVIVALVTSRMARANHQSRAAVRLATVQGSQSGLLTDSVVMTDNLATVGSFAVSRVIGTIPMVQVDEALRYTLGLL
jgi:mRNA interferase MazF